MHFTFSNVNDAYTRLLQAFHPEPDGNYATAVTFEQSRNGPVYILNHGTPIVITYTQPTIRALLNKHRNANPFFHLYEAIWMLSGSNRVDQLSFFNSKVAQYSDDGKVFNGAYGYRWRSAQVNDVQNWDNGDGVDQLEILIDHLKTNPNSRRAVLQMWNVEDDLLKIGSKCKQCGGTGIYKGLYTPDDPSSEYVEETCEDCDGDGGKGSKDVCCNLCVMFSIREETRIVEWSEEKLQRKIDQEYEMAGLARQDGDSRDAARRLALIESYKKNRGEQVVLKYLDMTVINRSNDLIWGLLGSNYVTFSVLQEYVATHLRAEVGTYNHVTNNLHLYPEKVDYPTLYKNRETNEQSLINLSAYTGVPLVKDLEQFHKDMKYFMNIATLPLNVSMDSWCAKAFNVTEPFFADVLVPMVAIYRFYKLKQLDAALTFLKRKIKDDYWRIATAFWLGNRHVSVSH